MPNRESIVRVQSKCAAFDALVIVLLDYRQD
jgi:hypothetical protein